MHACPSFGCILFVRCDVYTKKTGGVKTPVEILDREREPYAGLFRICRSLVPGTRGGELVNGPLEARCTTDPRTKTSLKYTVYIYLHIPTYEPT